MKIQEVIGIDVSKLTLDCRIHTAGLSAVFDNAAEQIADMAQWALDNSGASKDELLFVLEHTGIYSRNLVRYLAGNGWLVHVASGLEIKRSLGITRGKDDRADARRIALYGHRVRGEVDPYRLPGDTLDGLKRLMSMRKKLVVQRAGHKACLKEQQRALGGDGEDVLYGAQRAVIAALGEQIGRIEAEMDGLVDGDPELNEMFRLLTGIDGIGAVTARFLIAYTVGFTAFGSWRKFASYCGIAPFPNRSGTSYRGRTKVSHLANKRGKALLGNCAASAIQSSPEMKAYYERRLAEGKSKMSTLNIVRNKLLARAFAVIARGTPYVDTMKYAA